MSNFYPATDLIGGGEGALDALDGADLADGDVAIVVTDGTTYTYRLDDHSGPEEEDPPYVIAPDSSPGDKRWILQSIAGVDGATGDHFATREYVDLAQNAYKSFFISDIASGVGSLDLAYPHETSNAQSTIVTSAMGIGDAQLVRGFITEAGEPNTTTIKAGIITFHFHAKKGASNHRTTIIYAELYYVDADGTTGKTLLATTEDSIELTDTEANFEIHIALAEDIDIASTARLILDVKADVGSGAVDSVVTLYMEGTEDSYFSAAVVSGIWQNHSDKLDDLSGTGATGAQLTELTDSSETTLHSHAGDDTTYDATTWNANTDPATKNAIRDKVETMDSAIGLNTTHRGSDGSDHSIVGSNTTAIGLNTTHRGSDGSDHSFLDQAVTVASTPTLAGLIMADGGTIRCAGAPVLTFNDTDNQLEITGGNVEITRSNPRLRLIESLDVGYAIIDFDNNVGNRWSIGTAGASETYYGIANDFVVIDEGSDAIRFLIEDGTGKIHIGGVLPKTILTLEGTLTLKEQASANGSTAAYGQIWAKSGTPNTLWFMNDAGGDYQIGGVMGSIVMADGGTIGQSDGPLLTFDNTSNKLGITGCWVGINSGSLDNVITLTSTGVAYAGFRLENTHADDTGLSDGWSFVMVTRKTGGHGGVPAGALAIRQHLTASNVYRFVILDNGKVGVNDLAPASQFDVGGDINTTVSYKVDDVKVVGNRVIDARCDDAINSGDATTDGVIDSLRDAMITHGLIAAA